MHSAEEQVEHDSLDGLDENQLRRELIDARREITDLKDENSRLRESCQPIRDGGPAFPLATVSGMSLRDWFAGMKLSGLRVGDFTDSKDGAKFCYDYADAMLAEREAVSDTKQK